MNTRKIAVVTGAVALSMATVAHAGNNPFELNTLQQGYQVADATDSKAKDGKCSNGKCGADKRKTKEGAAATGKMEEGSGHHNKAKEGSCSAEKMKEGSCHASK